MQHESTERRQRLAERTASGSQARWDVGCDTDSDGPAETG